MPRAAVHLNPGDVFRDDLLSGANEVRAGRWVAVRCLPVSVFIEAGIASGTTIRFEGSFDGVTVHGFVADVPPGTAVLHNAAIVEATDTVFPFVRFNMTVIGDGSIGGAFIASVP